MKKAILLVIICFLKLVSFSQINKIELPLKTQNGYGPFNSGLSGLSIYSKDSNMWSKTYLKVSGVPINWVDVKFGDIETNIYQTVYQNYFLGNITSEMFKQLQKDLNWLPDTMNLSKKPLKCKIAFAYVTDAKGIVKMVVDANNNRNFSDDKIFTPVKTDYNENINKDSLAQNNTINVSFESFRKNKKTVTSAPLLIVNLSSMQMFLFNFFQHATTKFNGEEIAVCSDNFKNFSYKNPTIVLTQNNKIEVKKALPENVISKNEYIEIKNELYKFVGLNKNRNTLVLEKVNLPKSQLTSTQIGFKPYMFEGEDFKSKTKVSLESLKGKYVLLDFWAVSCGACRREMPNLKALYNKVDKSKFEIIGIVGDSQSNEINNLIDEYSLNWPQLVSDDTNKIKEKYDIYGYPTTFLLNPDGVIIAKDLREKKLDDKVLSLVK